MGVYVEGEREQCFSTLSRHGWFQYKPKTPVFHRIPFFLALCHLLPFLHSGLLFFVSCFLFFIKPPNENETQPQTKLTPQVAEEF